jgi:hypothetical protein
MELYQKCRSCERDEYIEKAAAIRKRDEESREMFFAAEKRIKHVNEIAKEQERYIDEKVDEKVDMKTTAKRFAYWLETSGAMFTGVHFFFPFFYSLAVTIIQIIRTDIVRTDFINAIFAVGKAFNGIRWLICKAASISGFIPNEIIEKILWWIIVVILTLIVLALISLVAYILFFGVKDFVKTFCDKLYLSAALSDLVVITFLGDIVKKIIPLNLVLIFIIIHFAFFMIRLTANTIIQKIEGRK